MLCQRLLLCQRMSGLPGTSGFRAAAVQSATRPQEPTTSASPTSALTPLRLPSPALLVSKAPDPIQPYLRLLRLDKPIGSWLLFLPSAWTITAASAPGLPPPELLALFGAGSVLMRGAACVINDLWDRDLDAQVARTRDRPLASGQLRPVRAYGLLSVSLASSFYILCQLNWLSIFIGMSSMALVASYPLAKRYTNWPQVVLGLTINWGAILGWTAVAGELNLAPVAWFYTAGLCWTLIYDTIYAHQDVEDDARLGLGSAALALGRAGTKPALTLAAVAFLASLEAAGTAAGLGQLYEPVLAIAGLRLAAIIWSVRLDSSESCWAGFRANRDLGLIVLAAVLLGALSSPEKEDKPVPLDYKGNTKLLPTY